jgi:NADH:ubiquinone oxidoreductase subunit E
MPEFLDAINHLQDEHPDELCVIEQACIAACDSAPSVLLDTELLAHMTLYELHDQIEDQIEALPASG